MRTSALICLILVASRLRESRCGPRYPSKAAELFRTKGEGLRGVRAEGSIMATPSPLRHETTRADSVFRDGDGPRRISKDDYTTTEEDESRNGFEASTFNPDVLNKFLEEYASKIKGSTEKYQRYPFRIVKPSEPLPLEVDEQQTTVRSSIIDHQEQNTKYEEEPINSTSTEDGLAAILNDTIKRNKYYGANSYDDRNGWVTLEAIPWSKSKISKWQATPSTQRPWPEVNKPWDKPGKPWTSDYSVRPIYENNKPWYEKPKPSWPENGQNDKPAWQKPNRPSPYYTEKPEETQAQKWPPERPSWNKYTDRPSLNTDIITDNRPANFPSNWNRPQPTKPSYQYLDRYPDKYQGEEGNDWHDFPTRLEDRPTPRPTTTTERPTAFSHYQYVNNHPQSYPGNGDGQWVLLSTNRGYSKSRQRSIKIDSIGQVGNVTRDVGRKEEEADPAVAVMTSKRQVRLTVLPSINGTNTTTSHGGLLEVEKTFKSVDQSQKEYEMERQPLLSTILKKRPIRNTLGNKASSSAVLAAVSAGILPATMAMMIPMILGRRKRDLTSSGLGFLDHDETMIKKLIPGNKIFDNS